jgi:secretion/DNA translocation related TadE-like protein
MVAFLAVLWLGVLGVAAYGSAVLGRHRAETAADLAALAGAARVLDGTSAACSAAAHVAVSNGGVLRSCRIGGEDIEVEVGRPVDLVGMGTRTALARARAGPVEGGGAMP